MSDQTTNVDQAGYTTEPKREPMLSNEEIYAGSFTDVPWNSERGIGAANASKFYEAKITSGELMVVANNGPHEVQTEWSEKKGHKTHISCPITKLTTTVKGVSSGATHCPGCGAKIAKE